MSEAQATKVITGECRMSFLNWAKPRMNDMNGEEEYSACLLVPKSDEDAVARIKTAIRAAVVKKWGSDVPKNLRNPLRDGDTEKDGEEYVDHWFINVKSKRQPDTVDINRQPLMSEGEFRSGDFGRASLNAYAYDVKGNRGVALGLNGLQKTRDGDPIGAFSRAKDDFNDGFAGGPASAPGEMQEDDIFG